MDTEKSFERLRSELSSWEIPAEIANGVRERARESLDEVKALIDHFDNLGTRMLTVVASSRQLQASCFSGSPLTTFGPGSLRQTCGI